MLNLSKGNAGFRQMLKNALILALMAFGLWACGHDGGERLAGPQFAAQEPESGKEYIFAMHSLQNPERFFEINVPLIDYLNRYLPEARYRLEASRSHGEFEQKLYACQPDFAQPNPYRTPNVLSHGNQIIVRTGDEYKFAGVNAVWGDRYTGKLTDLKSNSIVSGALGAAG